MRILTSLTTARESFVYGLLMGVPDMNVQAVNDVLASEDHKDLWRTKADGTQEPLMMAFKRVEEIRVAAVKANQDVQNGMPVPPLPPSTLKKVKTPKAEVVATVAETKAEEPVVTAEPTSSGLFGDEAPVVVANDNDDLVDLTAHAV